MKKGGECPPHATSKNSMNSIAYCEKVNQCRGRVDWPSIENCNYFCDHPINLNGGIIDGITVLHGESIPKGSACQNNKVLVGYIYCDRGKWDPKNDPFCAFPCSGASCTCTSLPSIESRGVSQESITQCVNRNSNCNYICSDSPASLPVPGAAISCENGQWRASPVLCARMCNPDNLSDIDLNRLNFHASSWKSCRQMPVGGVCHIGCTPGYISKAAAMQCVNGTRLANFQPALADEPCTKICSDNPLPEKGVEIMGVCAGAVQGEMCPFKCVPDGIAHGEIYCNAFEDKWVFVNIRCEYFCIGSPPVLNARKESLAACEKKLVNETCEVVCGEKYGFVGAQPVCQGNLSWTGQETRCEMDVVHTSWIFYFCVDLVLFFVLIFLNTF